MVLQQGRVIPVFVVITPLFPFPVRRPSVFSASSKKAKSYHSNIHLRQLVVSHLVSVKGVSCFLASLAQAQEQKLAQLEGLSSPAAANQAPTESENRN